VKQELPKSIAVIVGDLFGDVQKLIQQEALLIKQNILMKEASALFFYSVGFGYLFSSHFF
jgi:hypothetical protein